MAGAIVYLSTGQIKANAFDHGELTGLSDDDHTQYHLTSGSRPMTGALDMNDNDIVDVDQIGLGTSTPDASAAIHVVDTGRGSIPYPVMTAAQMAVISSPAEGLGAIASDTEMFSLWDAQRYRNVGAMGWLPYAVPMGTSALASATQNYTLAANGGSCAIPIYLSGHMLLGGVTAQNRNTSLARTWGWDLYVQYLNNGNSGENTLVRIANSNANENFTPAGVTNRTIVAASAPVYLGPGAYWIVIQNRHATNTFLLSGELCGGALGGPTPSEVSQTKTTTNPNGATLDFVAATWTKDRVIVSVRLNGRVFGQTADY